MLFDKSTLCWTQRIGLQIQNDLTKFSIDEICVSFSHERWKRRSWRIRRYETVWRYTWVPCIVWPYQCRRCQPSSSRRWPNFCSSWRAHDNRRCVVCFPPSLLLLPRSMQPLGLVPLAKTRTDSLTTCSLTIRRRVRWPPPNFSALHPLLAPFLSPSRTSSNLSMNGGLLRSLSGSGKRMRKDVKPVDAGYLLKLHTLLLFRKALCFVMFHMRHAHSRRYRSVDMP